MKAQQLTLRAFPSLGEGKTVLKRPRYVQNVSNPQRTAWLRSVQPALALLLALRPRLSGFSGFRSCAASPTRTIQARTRQSSPNSRDKRSGAVICVASNPRSHPENRSRAAPMTCQRKISPKRPSNGLMMVQPSPTAARGKVDREFLDDF